MCCLPPVRSIKRIVGKYYYSGELFCGAEWIKSKRPEWQNVLRAGRAKALTLDEASNNRHRIHWTHRRMCLVYFRLNIFIFLCLHSSSMPPRFTLLPGTFFLLIYCSMVGVLRSRPMCIFCTRKWNYFPFFSSFTYTSTADGRKNLFCNVRVYYADAKF